MKNLNTKTLLAASLTSMISINSFATDPADSIEMTFDHPQSIGISDAGNTTDGNTTSIANSTWTITSNNAVQVKFSGTSPGALTTSTAQTFPQFYKQEVDARGNAVNKYDHLTTSYGIKITGQDSIETNDANDTWGGGSNATGTPANLVSVADDTAAAQAYYKAIMPNDTGTFTLDLYASGTGDSATTQSGNYTATVTTTLIAAEK
ncbi:MAG: hypothetical protein NZ811_06735 [Gammaproteobacteria bacterium]|nr:hypothetical protein [Gammaproteobacteria bacterium]